MLAAQNVGNLPAPGRDLARVIRVGLTTPEGLDNDEFQQLRYVLMNMLRVHQAMSLQHRAKVVDDETWMGPASSLRTKFSMSGGWRVEDSSDAYRAGFKAWIESLLGCEDPLALQQGIAGGSATACFG
jgi:hypothetical protein